MAAHIREVRGSRKMRRRPKSPALRRCLEVRNDIEKWKAIRQQVLVHWLSQQVACEKIKLD